MVSCMRHTAVDVLQREALLMFDVHKYLFILFFVLFDCGLLDRAKQTGLRKYFYIFPNFEFSWQWLAGRVVNGDAVLCLGLLHGGGGLGGGGGHGGGGHGGEGGQEAVVGTDHGGVVDDVLGGVVGHVLLDRDLGHMLDLVVDLVADMLDHGGSVDHGGGVDQGGGGSGDGVVHGHRGGLHLNRLHLHGLQGGVGDSRGGSVGDDGGGHMLDHGHGLGDGINES